jgi:hypothetical protein
MHFNFFKERENKFNSLTKNFKHEKISSFVVCHKIKKNLFNKLYKSANEYIRISKKYGFINRTPNGKIVPKKEVSNQYLRVIKSYRDIILSMNFENKINKWVFPVVRYKDIKMDKNFKNRPTRSELPHSDSWAGWDENSILVQIPIKGDLKNNRVIYYEMPDKFNKNWLTKKVYTKAQKNFVNLCKPINHHYKKGYVYLSDIIVVHKTKKNKNCKPRCSIDIPIILKPSLKNNYGIRDCLSTKEIKSLGKNLTINCPLYMGQIDGIAGRKSPTTCEIVKLRPN